MVPSESIANPISDIHRKGIVVAISLNTVVYKDSITSWDRSSDKQKTRPGYKKHSKDSGLH